MTTAEDLNSRLLDLIGIVLKELKASRYWLRLTRAFPLVKPSSRLDPLLDEAEELIAIFGKSLSTTRKGPFGAINAQCPVTRYSPTRAYYPLAWSCA
jgi:hypothetical protein